MAKYAIPPGVYNEGNAKIIEEEGGEDSCLSDSALFNSGDNSSSQLAN